MMNTEFYCDFRKWVINSDQCGYRLSLPFNDFRRIQKGFSTDLMVLKRERFCKHRNNPTFPWVIRCLSDLDDIIYAKGIVNIFFQLTNIMLKENVNLSVVQRWRSLSSLFSKFKWRDKALEDTDFLKGLICFLSPGDQKLFIDNKLFKIMEEHNCPLPRKNHVFVKEFMVNYFYQWLEHQNESIILKIFCGVHGSHNLKMNKKRKLSDLTVENKYDKDIESVYQNITVRGNRKSITRHKAIKHLALLDIVYLSYKYNTCKQKKWSLFSKSRMYKVINRIIENGTLEIFSPVASLPKSAEKPHQSLRQMDVFPVIMMPKNIKDELIKFI